MRYFALVIIALATLLAPELAAQDAPAGRTRLLLKGGVANLGYDSEKFETAGSDFALGLDHQLPSTFGSFYPYAGVNLTYFRATQFTQGGGSSRPNGVDAPVISHTSRGAFLGAGGFLGLGRAVGRFALHANVGLAYLLRAEFTKIEVEHIGSEVVATRSPYWGLGYGEVVVTADNRYTPAADNRRLDVNLGGELTYALHPKWIIGTEITYRFYGTDNIESTSPRDGGESIRRVGRSAANDFERRPTSLLLTLRYVL